MGARRKFAAGNWKMNTTRAAAVELAAAVVRGVASLGPKVDVLVCPPHPYLIPVADVLRSTDVMLGAQDVYFEPSGAFTGEVAVPMLVDVGCRYVIVGHSERRHILGETDDVVGRKVSAALAGGIEVILCVGELLAERQADRTAAVLDSQMAGGLRQITDDLLNRVTIAYEPVWAIGTGVTATPQQAQEAHRYLRNWVANRYNSRSADGLRILYGGSVKPDNALELMSQPDVDGALVGGASLKAESFLAIIEATAQAAR